MNGNSNGNHSEEIMLGVSMNELAELSADDLTGNAVAIKMLLHYYKQLVSENNTLQNQNNTYETYVSAYNRKKSNTATGSILLSLSSIFIGFGVNLLTNSITASGILILLSGIALIISGNYFTFFKERD